MDYALRFTQRALRDLSEILGYIADDEEDSAFRFGNSLLDHVDLLQRSPHMASTIRSRSNVRKLVHSPIVIYYRVDDERCIVEILHFRHSSRREPRF